MKQKIILASRSPRRARLLKQAGLGFKAKPSAAREYANPALPARKFVEVLAEKKALDVASRMKNALVIGADTILVCKGKKLGKPKNKLHAVRMLKQISGSKLSVYSGIAVIDSKTGRKSIGSEKTKITIRKLKDEEIRAYIRTKEPLDKAGAIAIQGIGAKFISRVDGSSSNVVGLPLECLHKLLKKFGVKLVVSERCNL